MSKTSAASNRAVLRWLITAFCRASSMAVDELSIPRTEVASAVPQRVEREPARVAVEIEHPLPLAVRGDGAAVLALVEVEARLLARP